MTNRTLDALVSERPTSLAALSGILPRRPLLGGLRRPGSSNNGQQDSSLRARRLQRQQEAQKAIHQEKVESRGAQVDLLIDRRDGIANLCEMKYSANEFVIDKQEDANIANRVAAFRKVVGSKRTIHVTLVTANGLKHNVYWNNVQSEIGLDDLFA